MDAALLAGRAIGEIYEVHGREDLHDFLVHAVEASGGRVLYVSDSRRAPVFLGVQLDSDQRLGMLVYPFRMTRNRIKNRPTDEVRGQLRYGSEESWRRPHPVGRDIAGVDVTMIVGIDIEDGIVVGLDASLWDPLPMGISFYAKQAEISRAKELGWHYWEKVNRPGSKRAEARSPTSLETVVAFTADRLIDYARLELQATLLKLDPPLRYSAAKLAGVQRTVDRSTAHLRPRPHLLEEQFQLSSETILDIISGRNRLSVAVRGGVAEHHLKDQLMQAPGVAAATLLDADAKHDFDVILTRGAQLRVECKNASPNRFADGCFKVEVQKTRASKGDPASRFYPVDSFDVVAACLYSVTGKWEFRFARTSWLVRHRDFPDRLAPIQRVSDEWVTDITDARPRD